MKICFIQHEPYVAPGYFLEWAQMHHYQTEIIDCHHQKPTGNLAQTADMLVVLGGPQNPHTTIDQCFS
ncbi:hypothetical protein [Limosilactobacillus frumenti]|uniref:hypothetical protein n=1 Tax=Limosilactobacillus frumenti TaxID=104955 RepID=UPI00070FC4C2|nr:hypothetical protein [Limosilactobacillus frumenti]MBA2913658.1 hypothetical protein [Limosilactobacillus frumenti]QFG73000.1 hypothetical protein LF145_06575 [Limosilactobacillus frumenti]